MESKSPWQTWLITLLVTWIFGFGTGFSLHVAMSGGDTDEAPDKTASASKASKQDSAGSADLVLEEAAETSKTEPRPAAAAEPFEDPIWPARHLFIAVDGQWLSDDTKAFLREIKPGGVVLLPENIQNQQQTLDLVREIKASVGLGNQRFTDLPLVALDTDPKASDALRLSDVPVPSEIGQREDTDWARQAGINLASAASERGINILFSPGLNIAEEGSDPTNAEYSFGADQMVVAALGLAMADGIMEAGVLPVAKHFPGLGSASTGGVPAVLDKDIGGLARTMYPFNEAVSRNIPGLLVGHVAVPALDKEAPGRPAALSPLLVSTVLRDRWNFEGVILADQIDLFEETASRTIEEAAVQSLAAGCDAVLYLNPAPERIRAICDAIRKAVNDGTLNQQELDASKKRLDGWVEWLKKPMGLDGSLPELAPVEPQGRDKETTRVARSNEPSERSTPGQQPAVSSPPPTPSAQQSEPTIQTENTPPHTQSETVEPADETQSDSEAAADEPAAVQPLPEASGLESETPETDGAADDEKTATAALPNERASDAATEEPPPPPSESQPTKKSETESESSAPTSDSGETAVEEETSDTQSSPPEAGGADTSGVETAADESSDSEEPPDQPGEPAAETKAAKAETPGPAADTPLGPSETGSADPIDGDEDMVEDTADETGTSNEENDPEETTTVAAKTPEAEPPAEEDPAIPEDHVEVSHTVLYGENLTRIATLYGVDPGDLQSWNDMSNTSVQQGQTLSIHVPPDRAEAIQEARMPKSSPDVEEFVHEVRPGETLTGIANKYGVEIRELVVWNQLEDSRLVAGQNVKLYVEPESYEEVKAKEPETTTYRVRRGDTLIQIARQHGISPEELLELNGISDPNHIIVGQRLKVPSAP